MEKSSYQPDEIMSKQINILTTKELLERIHINLKKANYPLKEEKRKVVDEIMEKILEDGIIDELFTEVIKDKSEDNIILEEENIYEFIECKLMTYYYALYNDNVDLYNKIVEKGISLGNNINNWKLYLLNKELRDIFKNDNEYFGFISMFDSAIGTFYNSCKDNDSRSKNIEIFISILDNDKNYLYEDKEDNKIFDNLLTKRNIDAFGKEFLEKLNLNQKKIINSLNYHLNSDSLKKIKDLLEEYPNFNYSIEDKLLQDTFLDLFTIDEIGNMDEETKGMYAAAVNNRLTKRLKRLLTRYPDFTCRKEFIREEIFDNIDFETMSLLSDNAKISIASLKEVTINKNIKKIIHKDLKKTSNFLKKNKNENKVSNKKQPRRKL